MEVEASEEESNQVQIIFQVKISKENVRTVSAATINVFERSIQVLEFLDNEFYSSLESFFIQLSLSDRSTNYTLYFLPPDYDNDVSKIQTILKSLESVNWQEIAPKDLPKNTENIVKNLVNLNESLITEKSYKTCIDLSAYLINSLKIDNQKTYSLNVMKLDTFMKLDQAAMNALMIFPKESKSYRRKNEITILSLLEYNCKTIIGNRLLRKWIQQPLQDVEQIDFRLNAVEELRDNKQLMEYLSTEFLKKIPDLDKLYSKFYLVKNDLKSSASIEDCIKTYNVIKALQNFINDIPTPHQNMTLYKIFTNISNLLKSFQGLEKMITKSIDIEDKGRVYRINKQFSQDLKDCDREIQQVKINIENLRKQTEVKLKIDITVQQSDSMTFLFEAKKGELDQALRKTGQSMNFQVKTAKKSYSTFTSGELKELCSEYLESQELYKKLSQEVLIKILKVIGSYQPVLEDCALQVAQLDVLQNFAKVSISQNYCKPVILSKENYNQAINLVGLRHPQAETINREFIKNNCYLNQKNERLQLITGPNMGGKSTYLRAVAINVLLAHIGCYVACDSAEITIIDAIITRVGASDKQLLGISTFHSEMLETACMLEIASKNSLVIVDELGRGTSQSEGYGIACAIAQELAEEKQCFTLYATHFSEIAELANKIPVIKNYHTKCHVGIDDIKMEYKIVPGIGAHSYGINIMKMLNFPEQVVEEAEQMLQSLEV